MIPSTIKELTDAIEGRFPVGPSTTSRLSVTGEEYVTIGSQYDKEMMGAPGTVDECESQDIAFDEQTACMQAYICFGDYAEERNGILYWRIKPQLDWNNDNSRCVAYMRCLISGKPVIPSIIKEKLSHASL